MTPDKPDLIDRMAQLRPWQILTLGALSLLNVLVAITVVAHLCYEAFPGYWGWVAIGHILVVGLTAWFLPKPFITAYLIRKYQEEVAALIARFADEDEDAK